jgi:hypothetical protein
MAELLLSLDEVTFHAIEAAITTMANILGLTTAYNPQQNT